MSDSAETDAPQESRRAERTRVALRVGFRKRGTTRADGDLLDLSATGFRVDTSSALAPGMQVWLNLPGLETRAATVAWVRGFEAGCKFDMPFHEAVMADFLARNRAG